MPGKAKVLSSKEIQTVLKGLKNDRDRALFATGLYTGLRISEIIAVGQNDVFTTSGWHTQYSQDHQTKKVKYRIQQHPNPP